MNSRVLQYLMYRVFVTETKIHHQGKLEYFYDAFPDKIISNIKFIESQHLEQFQ